jgi:endonuclease I
MKALLSFCTLVLICIQVSFAQTLLVSTNQVSYANCTTGLTDSSKVTLSVPANSPKSVIIRNIVSLNKAFYVKDTAFALAANSSKDIWVYFSPIHNINHLSYLVIVNNTNVPQRLIQLKGTGVYAEPYYAATQNLSEQALKDALKTIVSTGQASCTYNGARDQMFMIIDNKKVNGQGAAVNTLECVYTGREAVGYTARTDAQTNSNFNTEHTWPQSLFNSATPMVCDLHHLFPTDEVANGTRSNYPFGTVNNPTWTTGGSRYANGIFEPRDFHKGHVARAMMYFVMRYQDYSNFFAPQETILRQWHKQFAPTALDTKRNNDVFAYQGNRNPFIDHPEIIDRITLLSGTSVAPLRNTLYCDTSAVSWTVNANDSIKTASVSMVNTGNTPVSYNASFAQQLFMFKTATDGSIPQDSAQTFTFRYSGTDSVSFIQDTLVLKSSTSNAGILRIPVTLTLIPTTGIENTKESSFTFHCFPNPSNNELSISSHNAEKFTLTVVTLHGQEVCKHMDQSSYRLNTTDWTNGLYFVIGNTPTQMFRTKLYIQH